MSGETPNTKNQPTQATVWDTLADYDAINQNLQDEFLNIEDMLSSGRITEEQADRFREEVTARANEAKQPKLDAEAQQYLDDEFLNIEDMLHSGRINEEQAEKFRKEVEERAYRATFERAHTKQPTSDETNPSTASAEATTEPSEPEPQVATKVGAHARIDNDEAEARHGAHAKVNDEENDFYRGAHTRVKDEDRAKLEDEERARLEEEERAKLEAEEAAKLERAQHAKAEEGIDLLNDSEEEQGHEEDTDRIRLIDSKLQAIDAELSKRREKLVGRIDQKLAEIDKLLDAKKNGSEHEPEDDGPLVAVNANFTHDKKELAHDYAEQDLNDELATSGFIKKIWKGNLFRKYYQKKYEQEYLSGERTTESGDDLDDVIADRSDSAIKRFVLGATDEYNAMVHTKAGESLTEADSHTTEVVKDAIEWFAGAEVPAGGSISDLTREFSNRIKRLQAEGEDRGEPINETLINNYYDVAMQARQRVEHGAAMDRVMDGFKVYNAEVRDGMRTEAHRDNIDKITNWLEGSKIGALVPPEAIAAAVGTAWGLTQVGARAAVGVGGALGIAGAVQGLRARNRVTEDRARMMRDVASGYEYGNDEDNRRAEAHAKYETRIGGTLYDIRPANELIEDLDFAVREGDHNDIIRAIAEARVRIDYSDAERKDLVGYSSETAKGDERLALDLAVIKAENSLDDRGREDVDFMNGHIRHHLIEEIDAKDSAFKRLRAVEAVKAAGKSVAFGAAAFFGSQEIIAAIDPAKIGVFEKAGLLHTENANDASETILAGFAGPRTRVQVLENIEGDRTVEIDRYKEKGWEQIETEAGWTETKRDLISTSPAASDHQVRVAYDGWANNGTTISDNNELSVNLTNGQLVSSMSGNSTMAGESFDYEQLAASGRIKGYVTVGGAKFEVASTLNGSGQLTWGENGTFTTTTGETIQAFGENGEKLYQYFEVALDNGTDADGVTHIMPFATDTGLNTFSGTIDQVADTTIEHPAVYSFAKEVPREVTFAGIATPGITSPTGLGVAYGTEPSEPISTPESESTQVTDPILESISEPEPVPTPEPEPTPELSSASSEPASTFGPEPILPSEPESSPELPEESEEDAFRTQVSARFGDLVGDEGVDFMTTRERGEGDSLRIANWWNSLSDEAKNAVIDFETTPEHPELGGNTLRTWLQAQGVIPLGSAAS